MKTRHQPGLGGTTLIEMLAAAAVFGVLCAAVVTGVISLQRNFSNTRDYATNHSAQLRISDYIARDLRQATAFSQTGSGSALVMTLDIPNFYTSSGAPRPPVINADGTVSYKDSSVNPPKTSSRIRYFINNQKMYREVDGAAKPIAEDVAQFIITPLDSTTAAGAAEGGFNLTGITGKVAEIKVQVNFRTKFGSKPVTQTFYNMTLMRNARTDAQTNLY
jgi:type II secretory pathway pseudopilin PulG